MELRLIKQPAVLIKRYKRFLADVSLADGSVLTLHCPNTGSMKGCADPGTQVFYSDSANLRRKYRYTWELAKTRDNHWICINTSLPNKIVGEALQTGLIPELAGYSNHTAEVSYGEKSRIDWLLQGHHGQRDCYLEVKNVTLLEHNQGYFPDAVSTRAVKHLGQLTAMAATGNRAVLFYLVGHSGVNSVAAAAHIDPDYQAALTDAIAAGVEVLAYRAQISTERITLTKKLAVNCSKNS